MSGTLNQAPFEKRYITVSIDIPEGTRKLDYSTNKFNGVSFQRDGKTKHSVPYFNYRIDASIVAFGGQTTPQAAIQIYDMNLNDMMALANYGSPGLFVFDSVGKNIEIRVYAGSQINELILVFEGYLVQSHIDFTSAPDPFLFIQAGALPLQLMPRNVVSYKGDIEASVIMRQLADELGLAFENNGVTAVLTNPYLSGSAKDQANKCAELGRFNWLQDSSILAIWPLGGSRRKYTGHPVKYSFGKTPQGEESPSKGSKQVLSKETGLIGYPSFNGAIVGLRTLFRNDLRQGDLVKVESDFLGANGEFTISSLAHHISSEVNGGPWFSELQATRADYQTGTQKRLGSSA